MECRTKKESKLWKEIHKLGEASLSVVIRTREDIDYYELISGRLVFHLLRRR